MSPIQEFLQMEKILSRLNSDNENKIIEDLTEFLCDYYLTFDFVILLLRSKLSSKNISDLLNNIKIAIATELFSVHNYMEIFMDIILITREIDKYNQELLNTVEFVFKPDEYKRTNFKQTIYYKNEPYN